MKVKERAN